MAPVFVVLAGFLAISAHATSAGFVVHVEVPLETETVSDQVKLEAQWLGSSDDEPEIKTLITAVQIGREAVFENLLLGSVWQVGTRSEEFWSASKTIVASNPRVRFRMTVWPTGVLSGRIVLDPGERDTPASISARFEFPRDANSTPRIPRSTVTCPVQNNRFRCVVPAGNLDLRLRAAGYISRFAWNVRVKPRETGDIGAFRLQRGSSVIGWVETVGGPQAAGRARVELTPQSFGNQPWEEALSMTVEVDDRGFFHFQDVPPGQHVVVARQEGFAPARKPGVLVVKDSETELPRPLYLEPPQPLEVFVDPPMSPRGMNWRLELFKQLHTGSMDRVSAAELELDGWWRHDSLSPGDYQLWIRSETGDWWFNEKIELRSDSPPFMIELPILKVAGRVQVGSRPLEARLTFTNKIRGGSIGLSSNDDGEFEGVLSGPGRYYVRIIAIDKGVDRRLTDIEVKNASNQEGARVEIRLPNTSVPGVVVDELGRPVERAHVVFLSIDSPESPVSGLAKEDGSFRLEGLPEGRSRIMAETEDGRISDWADVSVVEDVQHPLVRLTVRPQESITGQVLSRTGPIPGARVEVIPVQQPLAAIEPASTDAQGKFDALVPEGTREVLLNASAPGFGLLLRRLRVPPDRHLVLELSQVWSTLKLQLPASVVAGDWGSPQAIVVHNGAHFSSVGLEAWARVNGQTQGETGLLVVPRVEYGEYLACALWISEIPQLVAGLIPQNRCASGYAAPLGDLTLEVPSPKSQQSKR